MDNYEDVRFKHTHFIGVGGIGMSAIARVLLQMGYPVSGSDLRTNRVTAGLEELGAQIFCGHDAAHVADADVVVVSSAIPEDNPELLEARKRGLKIMQRGQMLSWLMHSKVGIAVAGTHGKTTTTSMVASMLDGYGLKPTVVVGGEIIDYDSNAKLGGGDYLVAEADESDASFVELTPHIAIVSSIDPDVNFSTSAFNGCGLNHEAIQERVDDMFMRFMHKVNDKGLVIMCLDHPRVRQLYPQVKRRVVTYGLSSEADITATDIVLDNYRSRCRVFWRGKEMGELRLHVPGRHNVQNALAAVAVGLEVGMDFSDISRLLEQFHGVRRRFQVLGQGNGIIVVDDYAHNPSKVRAAIHAARTGSAKRVITVFQPHRYTRTKFFEEEYASSFDQTDVLVITDIYSAGEDPIEGVSSANLAEAVRRHENAPEVVLAPTHEDILAYLGQHCQAGDIVLFAGAGDISKCTARAAELLTKE